MSLREDHRLNCKILSGFGWVNASYVYGLTIVNTHMKRACELSFPTLHSTFSSFSEAGDLFRLLKHVF